MAALNGRSSLLIWTCALISLHRLRRSQHWTRPFRCCRCHLTVANSLTQPPTMWHPSYMCGGLGLGLAYLALASSDLPPALIRTLAASVALTLSMPSFAQGIGYVDESTIKEIAAQTRGATTATESSSNANELSFNVCDCWTHAYPEMRHLII